MTDDLDLMEVTEDIPVEITEDQEFEVIKIVSRKEAPDGMEHLYEVHWQDGDVTFEPVSNLGSASDALRKYLEENHPSDSLLKMLSALTESDNDENGPDKANANGVEPKLNFLARWHQKTTRGSTQYWLRKGDDRAKIPSLLKREIIKDIATPPKNAPLMPQTVPDTPETPELESPVLFSEGEGTPGTPGTLGTPASAVRIRKRIRIVEETVKMFPHEELYDLEQQQNKTLALWQEMLSGVLLVGCCVCLFVYLYHTVYRSSPAPAAQPNPTS